MELKTKYFDCEPAKANQSFFTSSYQYLICFSRIFYHIYHIKEGACICKRAKLATKPFKSQMKSNKRISILMRNNFPLLTHKLHHSKIIS